MDEDILNELKTIGENLIEIGESLANPDEDLDSYDILSLAETIGLYSRPIDTWGRIQIDRDLEKGLIV